MEGGGRRWERGEKDEGRGERRKEGEEEGGKKNIGGRRGN